MKKTRKIMALICSFLLATPMMAGCGQGDSGQVASDSKDNQSGSDGPVELVFWNYVEQHTEFFDASVERWNKENPDEQISLSSETYPTSEMHSKLMIVLQSGSDAPDIVDVNVAKFSEFMQGEEKPFIPLNDVIEPEMDSFLQPVLDIYKVDGNYYAIEYHVGAPMMFYNTEILGEAGVKVEDIVTWDDFHEAGKKVLEATGKPMITWETSDSWGYYNMIGTKKGDYFDADGNCTLNSEQNVEVLQFMLDMINDGTAIPTPGGNTYSEEFFGFMDAGGAASLHLCAWYLDRFTDYMTSLKGKIQLAAPPIWSEEEDYYAVYGGTGTAITTQCEYPDLAKRFLADAKISKEGAANIWNELGFDPLRWDIWETDAVHGENKFTEYFGDNFFDVLLEMKGTFLPMNITSSSKFSTAQSAVNNSVLFNVLNDKSQTPKEALDAAYQEVENAN